MFSNKNFTVIYFYARIIKCMHGLIAQWTRARGYEPRSQGFESLLAQTEMKNYIVNKSIKLIKHGASPSGKASDFDSAIRRFKSFRPRLKFIFVSNIQQLIMR